MEACSRRARTLVAVIETLRNQIVEYERRIAELVKSHPEGSLFGSLPGAGPVLMPRDRGLRHLAGAVCIGRGGATSQRHCPGDREKRQVELRVYAACLPEIPATDVPRVCRPLDGSIGMGQSLL